VTRECHLYQTITIYGANFTNFPSLSVLLTGANRTYQARPYFWWSTSQFTALLPLSINSAEDENRTLSVTILVGESRSDPYVGGVSMINSTLSLTRVQVSAHQVVMERVHQLQQCTK
jgi:hypothetical protein